MLGAYQRVMHSILLCLVGELLTSVSEVCLPLFQLAIRSEMQAVASSGNCAESWRLVPAEVACVVEPIGWLPPLHAKREQSTFRLNNQADSFPFRTFTFWATASACLPTPANQYQVACASI